MYWLIASTSAAKGLVQIVQHTLATSQNVASILVCLSMPVQTAEVAEMCHSGSECDKCCFCGECTLTWEIGLWLILTW